MTDATDKSVAAVYGDWLTFSNDGSGVSSTLNQIQDGLGNNTAIKLSSTQLKVVDTVAVFVTSVINGEPPAVKGGIFFDDAEGKLKGSDGTDWYTLW